jgi:hypothetical protein
MNLEIEQIEDLLRSMRPRTVSADRKSRIDAAVRELITHNPLHEAISTTRPSPLSPALASRLEELLSRIPHPDTQKVVHFPAQREQHTPPAWRKMAVAAAVALLGATSAFLVPNSPTKPSIAKSSSPQRPVITAANAESLVPAGYRRGLSEAKYEGIVWQPQYGGPHRRLKLVYRELVTLRDSSGRVYQVERPRVEYVLVPAKID